MGEVTYCPDCGRPDNRCICNFIVEQLEDNSPDFIWEHAHEGLTNPETSTFRTILPQYE